MGRVDELMILENMVLCEFLEPVSGWWLSEKVKSAVRGNRSHGDNRNPCLLFLTSLGSEVYTGQWDVVM